MSTIRALARSTPDGSVSTAVAPTASWPSRNTVARTGHAPPTTALAGNRPASATGETSTTGMRPMFETVGRFLPTGPGEFVTVPNLAVGPGGGHLEAQLWDALLSAAVPPARARWCVP